MAGIARDSEFSFLHAADLHLGSPIAAARRAGLETELREATYAALDSVVQAALDHDVDFVTLGGDLYDEADQSNPEPQLRLRNALARLGEKPVYVIRGNHDHLSGRLTMIRPPANVIQFDGARTHADFGWVRVHGVSYHTRHVPNLLPKYAQGSPEKFNVGLFHGTVGDPGDHERYSPCTLDELRAKRYEVWALGHIHMANILSQDPLVFYPGNIQGRNPRETGAKGAGLVTVDRRGKPQLTAITTHSVLIRDDELDISDCSDLQDVETKLRITLQRLRADTAISNGAVIRITLRGSSDAHDELAFAKDGAEPVVGLADALNAEFGTKRPFIVVDRIAVQTTPKLDLDALASEPNALGELVRVARRSESALRERLAATTLFSPDELTSERVEAMLQQAAAAALPRLRGGGRT